MGKKTGNRIIAIILVIAFFFTSLSLENLTVQAEEVEKKTEEKQESVAKEEVAEAKEYEVTESDARLEENTETSTTFDVGDNKKMTVFYQDAVRYENEKGELIDYDPTLISVEEEKTENDQNLDDYVYENAEGDKKQYFPETLSAETPILMEHEDYGIAIYPEGTFKNVKIEKEEYTNSYEETQKVPLKAVYDVQGEAFAYEYTSTSSGVKEEIVLEEKPENNQFQYDLKLTGMTARKNQLDEGITLYDSKSEEIVGSIARPNMNDATGEAYSEELTCDITKDETEEGLYHVTITADKGYLEDVQRKYPVTIDPSASWSGKSDIGDAYVLNGSSYKGIR